MKTAPTDFVTRLVQNYGGPMSEFDARAALTRLEGADYRFRKGEIGEWRRVFTAGQRARVTDAMPRDIAQRFGWTL